ncbi:hypothetical protein ABPG74_001961, partial [Tetrahymena malaccensis]
LSKYELRTLENINLELNQYLRGDFIDDVEISGIAYDLEQCVNIRYLQINLMGFCISPLGMSVFFSAFKSCTHLRVLYLRLISQEFNQICATLLGQQLLKCKNLQELVLYLDLSDTKNQGAANLTSSISQHKNINTLCLGFYKAGIKDISSDTFQFSENLLSLGLSLRSNRFLPQDIYHVSNSLQQSKNLQYIYLNLRNNSIGEQGALSIFNALSGYQNLKSLQIILHYSRLSLCQFSVLLKKFLKLTNLSIDIYLNQEINDLTKQHLRRKAKKMLRIVQLQIID